MELDVFVGVEFEGIAFGVFQHDLDDGDGLEEVACLIAVYGLGRIGVYRIFLIYGDGLCGDLALDIGVAIVGDAHAKGWDVEEHAVV